MSCINILTDIFMLALPLPVVWGLRINKTQKWLVSLSFIMGGSACIVCLVRLLFVLRVASTPDPTWLKGDSIPSGITSTFEHSVGIFAASFPTYRPLYRWLSKGTLEDTTAHSNSFGSGRQWNGRSQAQRPDPHRIIKLTTIRSEVDPRDTNEERLYVVGSNVSTNRDGTP
ncbi:hypothetical protein PSPO01_01527 [Paraphaeosphaeria sporulosa]